MGTNKNTEKDTIVDKKIDKHPVLYVFSFIILVIIVVTFLGSPIAGKMSDSTRIVFGKYDKKNIEFFPGNYLSEQKDILARNLDKNSTDDIQYQAYQVWRGAFERTVIHTAILDMAEKSDLNVSDSKIDEMLVTQGPYTVNGEFSLERYNNTSRAERNRHRVSMKQALIKEKYLEDFFYGIKTSSKENRFISEMGKKERAVEIAYTSFSNFPDSQIIEFAKSNPTLFRSMELSKITITSGKKDAEKIHSMVSTNPDSFMDTARNQSKDSYADNGGDMGRVNFFDIKMELRKVDDAEAVYSLSRGEISPVFEATTGWVIYKCNAPSSNPDFTESASLDIVRNYMRNYESGLIEDYFATIAEDLKTSDNFRQDALSRNFEFYETEPFPINFGNHIALKQVKIDTPPPELSRLNYNEEFLLKSFSLKESEISDPVLLGNSLIMIKLLSYEENNEIEYIIDSYYPYILQQINDYTLTNYILRSDKLEDNFNTVFSKYFLSE